MVPKAFISEVFWLKQIGSLFGSEGLLLRSEAIGRRSRWTWAVPT
jgi:hypothetical protein